MNKCETCKWNPALIKKMLKPGSLKAIITPCSHCTHHHNVLEDHYEMSEGKSKEMSPFQKWCEDWWKDKNRSLDVGSQHKNCWNAAIDEVLKLDEPFIIIPSENFTDFANYINQHREDIKKLKEI